MPNVIQNPSSERITLEFSITELNVIVQSLVEGKWKEVNPIIQSIDRQVKQWDFKRNSLTVEEKEIDKQSI